ncbi:CBASS oligonucleotide cyclase [uncultured Hymenobacter sp.]|uniref:CBASS oligonucleotide cyclase n=1 Tax=uncultured Hymenobacter sp. TaxID=170016 RepID=UPI0035CB1A6C
MELANTQLKNFVDRIRLSADAMPKYRTQITNLRNKLQAKIDADNSTGIKVTRFIIAGSWKKHTVLRPKGEHPVDVDLVLFVSGDESLQTDVDKLHDFVVKYLLEIYPIKEVGDVEAEGKTKAIRIVFKGTGLEVDIVPVVPLPNSATYVWQPERGGGGRYITSVDGQLDHAAAARKRNPLYTSVVRMLKYWRNHQELKPELTSFAIELVVDYLDATYGVKSSTEESIIRFFGFVSGRLFPTISFPNAINQVGLLPLGHPVWIADPTNNENNAGNKITTSSWTEVKGKALVAFEALNYAQAKADGGGTVDEWKEVFGPSFSIDA